MKNKKQKKIEGFEKNIFIIFAVILALPSVIYLIKNKTILNFNEWFTFFLKQPKSHIDSIVGAICFGLIMILLIIYYFKIVKKTNYYFKNFKSLLINIIIITIIFAIMVPFTTSDIFYYMGTGWIDSKYGVNPYKTTVEDVLSENPNDAILQRTGVWKNQVVVYGPVWAMICKILSFCSFGNVTLALYIFKLASAIIHILNAIIIYKITSKKKFAALYGLNPFLLFEMITNVHNDLYLIFFVILSIYFLLKKKNIVLTIIFMAIATAIKYVSILLIPFFVLYYLRDKKNFEKVLYCFLYALLFIAVIILCYLPYTRDIKMFLIMTLQQHKYRESIFAIALEVSHFFNKLDILLYLKGTFLVLFALIYFDNLIKAFKSKKIKFENIARNCNNIILGFIFLIITNLCPWYTSWLFITIFWQKSKMVKNILYIQFSYELVTLMNFALHSESYKIGLFYLPFMVVIILIFNLFDKLINKKSNKALKNKAA